MDKTETTENDQAHPNPYEGATITNIRRGIRRAENDRSGYLYGELRTADGRLLIAAELSYIQNRLLERLT